MFLGTCYSSGHTYTLAATGLKKKIDRSFPSREDANRYMYDLCAKYHLHIVEVYDDKHDKTYKCTDGVRFYIHRA